MHLELDDLGEDVTCSGKLPPRGRPVTVTVIPEYEVSFLVLVVDQGLFLLSSNSRPAPNLTLKVQKASRSTFDFS